MAVGVAVETLTKSEKSLNAGGKKDSGDCCRPKGVVEDSWAESVMPKRGLRAKRG